MAITGRAVALALLGLVLVVLRPVPSTVLWWLGAVAVLIAVDVLVAVSPKTLQWQRDPVGQVRLGEQTTTSLVGRNPGSRTVRALVRDAWQPSAGTSGERHTVTMPGGEAARLTTRLSPTRRGDLKADAVTVRSFGPMRLAARQRSVPVGGQLRSLPAFPSRRHLPSRLAQLRQIDGRSAVRIRGQGTEFDSLRDYVEGDDVRSIDWRATARRQKPVVRTWQPERDRRIILVLDTSRTSAGRIDDLPRLDSAMDAALLLTALASRAGDRIDLIAGDRQVRARVSGRTDRNELLHAVVEAMAPLEPALVEANWTALAGAVTSLTRRRALVVLLTTLEPAAISEGLLPVLPSLVQHHRVVIASVADRSVLAMARDRTSVRSSYDAAAAERTIALRQQVRDAVGRLGVTVLDEPPEVLPVALVDHYLALKRQGLL
ncbi:DUF58 domain-containing protein [Calidifontibacter sp. DB0510]|uniref:DUF58 domain-containing protein n=1 Tax=Metallococcus carri TaxID=1656884 RepID=A0A967EAR4_9MICO|nr:DUF58 domain-containing protein [Metallococcus carri]NHN56535.1 DUF58 domain-containing protein [Metallococcus carri]NOP38834.1 DUF58 domain-containing protein [Calidifontibacter sp. DB2511S]